MGLPLRLASDDERRSIPTTTSNRAHGPLLSTIVSSLPAAGARASTLANMDGAADAALGVWASVRGFFTPATLFVVVNLVIGTIALSSRSHQRRRRGNGNGYATTHDDAQHHHHQEQQPFHHEQHQENHYYDDDQHQQHHEQQYVPPPPEPAPLARTSSVLDRLRSIGLYRFRSGDFPPEYAAAPATDPRDVTAAPALADGDAHYARSRSEPAPAPREDRRRPPPSRMKKSSSSQAWKAEAAPAPAARVVRAAALEEEDDVLHYTRADDFTEDNFTSPTAQQQVEEEEEEEQYYREEYVPPLRPAPLARAPSVLERLRSFSLSRFRSGDIAADDAAAAVAELERNHTQYSRSRSEPSREQSNKGKKQQQQSAEAKMSKSSSEARKPAPAEEPEAEAGGVDARADDFINSFRKQLQLQRLNSLLNYKDMLNRGA